MTTTETIAMKCSDQYGDGVHVARAILGQYNDVYYDTYDDCNEGTAETLPRSIADSVNDKSRFDISPNPSYGHVLIDFDITASGQLTIISADGRVLMRQSYVDVDHYQVSIEDYTGIVFIEVQHRGTSPLVKKALIIR